MELTVNFILIIVGLIICLGGIYFKKAVAGLVGMVSGIEFGAILTLFLLFSSDSDERGAIVVIIVCGAIGAILCATYDRICGAVGAFFNSAYIPNVSNRYEAIPIVTSLARTPSHRLYLKSKRIPKKLTTNIQRSNLEIELLYLAIGTIIGKITYKSQASNILYNA